MPTDLPRPYTWPWTLGALPAQVARLDRFCTRRFGPSLAAMVLRAGRHLADILNEHAPTGTIGILAGPGMNGAGALLAGERLLAQGRTVLAYRTGVPRLDEARSRLPLASLEETTSCDVLVDGLLGYRAGGPPRGEIHDILESAEGKRWISLDVESGVDPATGLTWGDHVDAELVVALGCLKRGTLLHGGRAIVVDIGMTPEAYAASGLQRPQFDAKGRAFVTLAGDCRQREEPVTRRCAPGLERAP